MYGRRHRNTQRNANLVTVLLFIIAVAVLIALWQKVLGQRAQPTPGQSPAASATAAVQPTELPSAQPSGTSATPQDELYFPGKTLYFVQLGAYTDAVKAQQMQNSCAGKGLSNYLYDDGERLRVLGDVYYSESAAAQEKQRIENTYQSEAYVKQYAVPSVRLKITAGAAQVAAIQAAFAAYTQLLEQADAAKNSTADIPALRARFGELAASATSAAATLTQQTGDTSHTFVAGIRTGLETCARDFIAISQNDTQDTLIFYSQMKYTVVAANLDFYQFIKSLNLT
ncbi:MAG: hypothetical protein PHO66_02700 [Eubacteriales bacterium]|nr:hypothetical protein [Eubacteriales bacterium]